MSTASTSTPKVECRPHNLPPVAMTDNCRIVQCLIEGDRDTFPVLVPLLVDVEQPTDMAVLKEAVRLEAFGETSTVLAKDLILYKARLIESLTNRCSLCDFILTGQCESGRHQRASTE
jgi:hypothetical protein